MMQTTTDDGLLAFRLVAEKLRLSYPTEAAQSSFIRNSRAMGNAASSCLSTTTAIWSVKRAYWQFAFPLRMFADSLSRSLMDRGANCYGRSTGTSRGQR